MRAGDLGNSKEPVTDTSGAGGEDTNPRLAMPKAEAVEPTLAQLRGGKEELGVAQPIIGVEEPGRARDRTDSEGPGRLVSATGGEKMDPARYIPWVESGTPSRPKDRAGAGEPRFAGSGANADEAN